MSDAQKKIRVAIKEEVLREIEATLLKATSPAETKARGKRLREFMKHPFMAGGMQFLPDDRGGCYSAVTIFEGQEIHFQADLFIGRTVRIKGKAEKYVLGYDKNTLVLKGQNGVTKCSLAMSRSRGDTLYFDEETAPL